VHFSFYRLIFHAFFPESVTFINHPSFPSCANEEKLQKMEKEKADALEVAAQANQETEAKKEEGSSLRLCLRRLLGQTESFIKGRQFHILITTEDFRRGFGIHIISQFLYM
jgi:hypothetical protein